MAQPLSRQQIEQVRLAGARGIAALLEGWSLEEPGPDWNGSHLAIEEASTRRRLELVGCHATTRVEIRARLPRAPGLATSSQAPTRTLSPSVSTSDDLPSTLSVISSGA